MVKRIYSCTSTQKSNRQVDRSNQSNSQVDSSKQSDSQVDRPTRLSQKVNSNTAPQVVKKVIDEFEDRFPEDNIGCVPGEWTLTLQRWSKMFWC